MAKKNILALERKVKELFENDKSNPELYLAIKDLAEAILVVKGMAYNYIEADEISHNLASDLFMKLQEGFVVWKWTKYIWMRLYNYRSSYINETRSTELYVEDLVDLDKMKHIVFPQAEATFNGYNFYELESVVKSLPVRIKEIYDKYVRYKLESDEYTKIWMSIMLTVNYNKGFLNIDRIILFELDELYENYVRFMINLISKRLTVYLHKICGDDLSRRQELHELLLGYKSVIDD